MTRKFLSCKGTKFKLKKQKTKFKKTSCLSFFSIPFFFKKTSKKKFFFNYFFVTFATVFDKKIFLFKMLFYRELLNKEEKCLC